MRIGVEWACSDLSISTASACGLKASVLAIEWNTVYAKLDCAPFVHSTASIAQSFRHKPRKLLRVAVHPSAYIRTRLGSYGRWSALTLDPFATQSFGIISSHLLAEAQSIHPAPVARPPRHIANVSCVDVARPPTPQKHDQKS